MSPPTGRRPRTRATKREEPRQAPRLAHADRADVRTLDLSRRVGDRVRLRHGSERHPVLALGSAAVAGDRAVRVEHRQAQHLHRRDRLRAVRGGAGRLRLPAGDLRHARHAHLVVSADRRRQVPVLRHRTHRLAAGSSSVPARAVVGRARRAVLRVVLLPPVRHGRRVVAAQSRRLLPVGAALRPAVVPGVRDLRARAGGTAVGRGAVRAGRGGRAIRAIPRAWPIPAVPTAGCSGR